MIYYTMGFSHRRVRRCSRFMPLLHNGVRLLLLLLIHPGVVLGGRRKTKASSSKRPVRILNHAGVRIDLFWIHPQTRQLAHSNTDGQGIPYGGETALDSYVTHAFEVQEMADPKTGRCKHNMCRKAYFTVNSGQDQAITIQKDFVVDHQDSKTVAAQQAKTALQLCRPNYPKGGSADALQQMESLTQCVQTQMESVVQSKQGDVDYQAHLRAQLGERLTQYACRPSQASVGNHSSSTKVMRTTSALYNRTWNYAPTPDDDVVEHNMQVLFESDSGSQLVLVDDFIGADSQCGSLNYLLEPLPTALATKLHSLASALLSRSVENVKVQSKPQLLESWNMLSNNTDDTASNLRHEQRLDHQLADIFLFCGTPSRSNGGLFFPAAGVHLNTHDLTSKALAAVFADPESSSAAGDPEAFLETWVPCPLLDKSDSGWKVIRDRYY